MLERILRTKPLKMYDDDAEFLEDVIIENRQAMEMSQIYLHILNGMTRAFATIISNNLNIVMKFLASITIIIAIPTMIASFYGMNVLDLPLFGHASRLRDNLRVLRYDLRASRAVHVEEEISSKSGGYQTRNREKLQCNSSISEGFYPGAEGRLPLSPH